MYFSIFLHRSVVTARYVLIMLPPTGEPGLTRHLHQERVPGDRGEQIKIMNHFKLGQIDPARGRVQPVQGEVVRGRREDGGALRHRA